jgi:hypothetical protein
MPRIVELKPENDDVRYVPPTFYLEFSREEFPGFLENPTGTMAELGHPVKNLTITVKDHVWDRGKREWVTEEPDKMLFADDAGLPHAKSWVWLCGYSDEMCVCERVLGG